MNRELLMLLKKIKDLFSGDKTNARFAKLFVLLMSLSFAVYTIVYIIKGEADYVDIFFIRTSDLFMDFFNSVRDASQGARVYTVRHVIYPPMANLLYLVFSRFLPSSYNDTGWSKRASWAEHTEAIFFITLLTMACALLLFFLIYEKLNASKGVKFLFAIFAVINVPMLYMMERGNIIFFCLISLMVYAFTYSSESKLFREIGLIALAFAFSLKLYPVVFGYFLLIDKRYKDAIRCTVYGILMLIIPSFFFGGPACFVQIARNILSFSSGTGASSVSVISGYSGIPMGVISALAYLWCLICALCFAVGPFVHSERWKVWMMGLITFLCVPSLTSLYLWTFLLIPVIFFINSGKTNGKNIFFFVMMISLFLFTVFRFNSWLTVNAFLIYPFTAIISIVAVVDTVVTGIKKLKAARRSKEVVKE